MRSRRLAEIRLPANAAGRVDVPSITTKLATSLKDLREVERIITAAHPGEPPSQAYRPPTVSTSYLLATMDNIPAGAVRLRRRGGVLRMEKISAPFRFSNVAVPLSIYTATIKYAESCGCHTVQGWVRKRHVKFWQGQKAVLVPGRVRSHKEGPIFLLCVDLRARHAR